MTDIDNSLEAIASTILERGASEIEGWSEHNGQGLAFNLAALSGMLFAQMRSDREALAKCRARVGILHRKIGELVEAQGGEGQP